MRSRSSLFDTSSIAVSIVSLSSFRERLDLSNRFKMKRRIRALANRSLFRLFPWAEGGFLAEISPKFRKVPLIQEWKYAGKQAKLASSFRAKTGSRLVDLRTCCGISWPTIAAKCLTKTCLAFRGSFSRARFLEVDPDGRKRSLRKALKTAFW